MMKRIRPGQETTKMYLRQQRKNGLGYINHSGSWKRPAFSETSHGSHVWTGKGVKVRAVIELYFKSTKFIHGDANS